VIILVRHGRTQLNAAHCLQGRVDAELDEVGENQATAVGAYLAQRDKPAKIISSPLRRAQQTAHRIATHFSIDDVVTDDRWIEIDYGVYDGLPLGDVPREVWNRWRTEPEFTPEGGESFAAMHQRVHAACEELAANDVDGDVIIVSHVSPMKSASAWALGADPAVSHRSRLDQAAICRIDVGGANPVLVTFNECP
jgi:alpha-ribazole phosphatase